MPDIISTQSHWSVPSASMKVMRSNGTMSFFHLETDKSWMSDLSWSNLVDVPEWGHLELSHRLCQQIPAQKYQVKGQRVKTTPALPPCTHSWWTFMLEMLGRLFICLILEVDLIMWSQVPPVGETRLIINPWLLDKWKNGALLREETNYPPPPMPRPSGWVKTGVHPDIWSLAGEKGEDYKIQVINGHHSFPLRATQEGIIFKFS